MKQKQVKVFLSVLSVMLIAWTFSSCTKTETTPVSLTALNTAVQFELTINKALDLLATTTEGVAAGNHLVGSKALLETATTAAQAVAANKATTTEQEISATAQLTAAITSYEGSVAVAIAPASLVGQWTFDELTEASVGTAVKDYSGNSNNGTIKAGHPFWSTAAGFAAVGLYAAYPTPSTNIPTITADRYGNQHALHFLAGANVDIPYSASLNPSSITISLWAKADTLLGQTGTYKYFANNYMVAMSRWNGYKFQFQDTPRAFFTVDHDGSNYDNQDDNVTINGITKNWLHYVVTFTDGTMSFYINGQLTYSWTTANETGGMVLLNGAAGTSTAPQDLVIGQDLPTAAYTTVNSGDPNYLNWGGFYIGSLDDVRIYNTALNASQILSIYNLEKP